MICSEQVEDSLGHEYREVRAERLVHPLFRVDTPFGTRRVHRKRSRQDNIDPQVEKLESPQVNMSPYRRRYRAWSGHDSSRGPAYHLEAGLRRDTLPDLDIRERCLRRREHNKAV